MKRPVKTWSQNDLALLIGLRALGNDFDLIGEFLGCSAGEARGMLIAAKEQLKSGYWVERLLKPSERSGRVETDRVDPKAGRGRRFRVKLSNVRAAIPRRDVTAELMGDPQAGQNPSSKEL